MRGGMEGGTGEGEKLIDFFQSYRSTNSLLILLRNVENVSTPGPHENYPLRLEVTRRPGQRRPDI